MEFTLTPEALFWFKVAGWLFIGGCATWWLSRTWQRQEQRDDWKQTHQQAERERRAKINRERTTLTDDERKKLER